MKNAIVTGGGGDIGVAIAKEASDAGYRVGLLDIDIDAAQRAADSIDGACAIKVDVTDEKSVEDALDAFDATPDLLVNNAGLVRFGPLEDIALEDFRAVVDVNLVGCFVVARAVAKRMLPRGSGAIVNITSIGGVNPAPGGAAYGATKSGLAALTQLMSVEWGPQGLRVNAVAPGFIDAGMSAPFFKDQKVRDVRSGGVPLRRLGSAEDVARAVMFLASDNSSYISGQQIIVDGGVTHAVLAALPRE